MAQRLLRRLCEHCRVPAELPYANDEQLFQEVTTEWPAYRAVGCERCNHTGYFGRFPVAEIVEMNPELQQAISSGERDLSKLRTLTDGPLSLMAEGAARRVISGDTTPREAMRALGHRFWTDTARKVPPPRSAGRHHRRRLG